MTDWGDKIILGKEIVKVSGDKHTRTFLKNLKYVNGLIPDKATPISLEDYTNEVKHLR